MKRGFAGTSELGLVGAKGFEPSTPASRTQCATGLRYAPTWCLVKGAGIVLHQRVETQAVSVRPSPTGDFSPPEIHTVGQSRISTYGGLNTGRGQFQQIGQC